MVQENSRRPKTDPAAREGAREAHADPRAFNVIVGEAIRRHRQSHGWTQVVLAEQAGLSPNYIARLERGELGPSLFVANRICGALSISLDELVIASPSGTENKRTTTRRRALAS